MAKKDDQIIAALTERIAQLEARLAPPEPAPTPVSTERAPRIRMPEPDDVVLVTAPGQPPGAHPMAMPVVVWDPLRGRWQTRLVGYFADARERQFSESYSRVALFADAEGNFTVPAVRLGVEHGRAHMAVETPGERSDA